MESEDDNERNDLLRKRLEQYQKAQETEKKIRAVLMQVLESPAYERIMNVKLANPDLYANTANAVVYYYQRVKRKLTEQELMTLLAAQTTKKEGEIQIKRK